MKRTILLFLALLPVLGFGQAVNSLDNDGSLVPQNFRSPYVDRTARQVGDILTILVDESSTASLTANTNASKKDTNVVDQVVFPFLNALKVPLLDRFLNGLSSGANSSNAGTGSTTRTGRLQARIAVVVKQVLPNGNLVVEGSRVVKVNKDLQIYRLTGMVRRDDIRVDNTVLSTNVANADIETDGKGLIGDRQRRGILTRILDWLF